MNKAFLAALVGLSTGFAVVACGDDDTDPQPAPTPTGTVSPPVAMVCAPPAVPAADPAACTSTGALATPPDSATAALDGLGAFYAFGDSVSTICPTASAGQVCASGIAADALNDYSNYGAGFGSDMGEGGAAMDLAALGIAGVRFQITGLNAVGEAAQKVRPSLHMVDAAGTGAAGYAQNGFLTDKDGLDDVSEDGEVTIMFADLVQPSWSTLTDPPVFDASQVKGLQFQTATSPGFPWSYNFCVSCVEWLDAAGNVVDIP